MWKLPIAFADRFFFLDEVFVGSWTSPSKDGLLMQNAESSISDSLVFCLDEAIADCFGGFGGGILGLAPGGFDWGTNCSYTLFWLPLVGDRAPFAPLSLPKAKKFPEWPFISTELQLIETFSAEIAAWPENKSLNLKNECFVGFCFVFETNDLHTDRQTSAEMTDRRIQLCAD